ncbi:MAG: transglycosylase SLT domain-containing protein [Sedimenticola sp.]
MKNQLKCVLVGLVLLLTAPQLCADAFTMLLQQQREALREDGFPPTLREAWRELMAEYPAIIGTKRQLNESDLEAIPKVYQRELLTISDDNRWQRRLTPFLDKIKRATAEFNVPEAVIGAVILQESGGRPDARAKGSSAKGLMQTIDATFALARKHLAKRSIDINDPLNAEHSILAGSWYLDFCFSLAAKSFPAYHDRTQLAHWERALEFYYAGPKWGKYPRDIIYVKRKGKSIRINKGRYADGVLRYARGLMTNTPDKNRA